MKFSIYLNRRVFCNDLCLQEELFPEENPPPFEDSPPLPPPPYGMTKDKNKYEPVHDNIYSKTCATSTDSDKPVHPPIRQGFSFSPLWIARLYITKTCLYDVDPLKPHFYIINLGFRGDTLFFLFLLKNIDCGYSLEPLRRGGSNAYPQSMFWAEIWKISEFFIWKISFFGGKIFSIFV